MTYGLHVIQFPSGRFGFVGSVPSSLGDKAPATTQDIMAGRVYRRDTNGKPLTLHFPSFETREQAIQYAAERGYEVKE